MDRLASPLALADMSALRRARSLFPEIWKFHGPCCRLWADDGLLGSNPPGRMADMEKCYRYVFDRGGTPHAGAFVALSPSHAKSCSELSQPTLQEVAQSLSSHSRRI